MDVQKKKSQNKIQHSSLNKRLKRFVFCHELEMENFQILMALDVEEKKQKN